MNGMYSTYKGYFQNGRFVSAEPVKIPDNIEVHVTIVGGELPSAKTEAQTQREAFEDFFAAMADIEDEPITDEMLADLQRNRVNFRRELDL